MTIPKVSYRDIPQPIQIIKTNWTVHIYRENGGKHTVAWLTNDPNHRVYDSLLSRFFTAEAGGMRETNFPTISGAMGWVEQRV